MDIYTDKIGQTLANRNPTMKSRWGICPRAETGCEGVLDQATFRAHCDGKYTQSICPYLQKFEQVRESHQ
jgi:hypothetical protein